MEKCTCSTPSRICLFGEHQDYLDLEVVAMAVNLRFHATVSPRRDGLVFLKIRDEKNGALQAPTTDYEETCINLRAPIVYAHQRDYLKSVFRVLMRLGYPLQNGFDIVMNSEIPIGKGMSSSSAMVIVLIKALLTAIGHPDRDDAARIAELGVLCEVREFGEPGGMMDQYASALGNLIHLSFGPQTKVETLPFSIPGSFVLVDSLMKKNTPKILADAKAPTLAGMEELKKLGVSSMLDFLAEPAKIALADTLNDVRKTCVLANIDNLRILKEGLALLHPSAFDPALFGALLTRHHKNLRDGLGVSTPLIEELMTLCLKSGALGGKINGSGGGGCFFVYAAPQDAPKIVSAVNLAGFPAQILRQDSGCRTDSLLPL